jgi:hypothetical protein
MLRHCHVLRHFRKDALRHTSFPAAESLLAFLAQEPHLETILNAQSRILNIPK